MKFHTGDKVVHNTHGVGTVQVAGINGVRTVAFDNGGVDVVKTSELNRKIK